MKCNRLKHTLQHKGNAIGTFVKFCDPASVEILALAGFDFFVLDTEHVGMDRQELLHILRAAEASGITPIVRVKENNQVEILQNLDFGYLGVQVPNVDTPEQAARLVESVKYTPLGNRGLSPSVRACCYGAMPVREYTETANRETLIVSHCETVECVNNLDAILQVDGIDVIFIGPMDLSQSLGIPGETGSKTVQDCIAGIKRKVLASSKALGTTAATPEAARDLIAQGVQYILLGSDQSMMYKWGRGAIEAIRG